MLRIEISQTNIFNFSSWFQSLEVIHALKIIFILIRKPEIIWKGLIITEFIVKYVYEPVLHEMLPPVIILQKNLCGTQIHTGVIKLTN